MKFNHALLALAISVSGIAFASEKDHDTKPLHGGVVACIFKPDQRGRV